jgi:hypothetical protein
MQRDGERFGDLGTGSQQRHAIPLAPGNTGHPGDRHGGFGVELQWV